MPTTTFVAGQLVKLHPAWHYGYTAHELTDPGFGCSTEFTITLNMVGLYVRFVDDCVIPTLEGQSYGDGTDLPYYPVDIVLFEDRLIEVPAGVIILL